MLARKFAGNSFMKLALMAVVITGAAQAQTYTVLEALPGAPNGPANPVSRSVAQARDGNMYMTTIGGGGNGNVLQVEPTGQVNAITPLIGYVVSGLTLGTDGYLYGTNQNAGMYGNGQIYKVATNGQFTAIYDFSGQGDGAYPNDAPIQASNGLFYGTALYGGPNQESTAWSVSASGKFTVLHVFDAATEGITILSSLTQGVDGNFYGTAQNGGVNGVGTVYRMTPAGQVTVLYAFKGGNDGANPCCSLLLGNDGNFYGTTANGGTAGDGTIFKITPAGQYTQLYSLNQANGDGEYPGASLTLGSDGLLYGITSSGNAGHPGTLYNVSTSGAFKTLYTMCSQPNCTDGLNPDTTLQQNTNGLFYGATVVGGVVGCGSGGPGCGVVYSLNNGAKPFAGLVNPAAKEGAIAQILGQGFNSTSVVKFNGVQAGKVTSGGKILGVAVPAGATTGFVTVTTGSTTLTSAQIFRVLPTESGFTPTSGPAGTPVTITGTGLTQTTRVAFNGKTATFTVNSDTQVTATVPSGATSGKISITTQGGTTVSSQTFTVN